MPAEVRIEGLEPLRRRFAQFPRVYRREVRATLNASLGVLWENVPEYPPQPQGSTYNRTGMLGRSLGSGMGGGRSGRQPDIYQVRRQGPNMDAGEFGTRLEYAPFVIGDQSQQPQNSHWWTITDIAKNSQQKILKLFREMAQDLARFLEGKGLL